MNVNSEAAIGILRYRAINTALKHNLHMFGGSESITVFTRRVPKCQNIHRRPEDPPLYNNTDCADYRELKYCFSRTALPIMQIPILHGTAILVPTVSLVSHGVFVPGRALLPTVQ